MSWAAGADAQITQVQSRTDMQSGITAPDATAATTATIDTAGAKTVSGGALDLGGTISVGWMRWRGPKDTAYSCTLPASTILTSGASSLTVGSFVTDTPLTGTLPGNRRVDFSIGGTYNLAASQAAGAYTGTLDMVCDGIVGTINITGTVGTMLSIMNTGALDFGTVAPTGAPGSVSVSATGVRTGTNVDLFASAPTAASFSVTGEANQAYTISYPASALLTGPGTDLTLNAFTDDTPAPVLSGAGTGTFNVGATVSVGASQVAGAYSGTFAVTVNYN